MKLTKGFLQDCRICDRCSGLFYPIPGHWQQTHFKGPDLRVDSKDLCYTCIRELNIISEKLSQAKPSSAPEAASSVPAASQH